MMGFMILQVELDNNGYAELEGSNIKYWPTEGLPQFEGPIEGFEQQYPLIMQELITKQYVRKS